MRLYTPLLLFFLLFLSSRVSSNSQQSHLIYCDEENPCEAGMKCKSFHCVPESECTKDNECAIGQRCDSKKRECVQDYECWVDADCPRGKTCTLHECKPRMTCIPENRIEGDCGQGRLCTPKGRCVRKSEDTRLCETDMECGTHNVCSYLGICQMDSDWMRSERRKDEAERLLRTRLYEEERDSLGARAAHSRFTRYKEDIDPKDLDKVMRDIQI